MQYIDRKVFIIANWSPSVNLVHKQILSILAQAKFSGIPSSLQSLEGLDWLASHNGDLICFDENTKYRDRMGYAKGLIETIPDRFQPT